MRAYTHTPASLSYSRTCRTFSTATPHGHSHKHPHPHKHPQSWRRALPSNIINAAHKQAQPPLMPTPGPDRISHTFRHVAHPRARPPTRSARHHQHCETAHVLSPVNTTALSPGHAQYRATTTLPPGLHQTAITGIRLSHHQLHTKASIRPRGAPHCWSFCLRKSGSTRPADECTGTQGIHTVTEYLDATVTGLRVSSHQSDQSGSSHVCPRR